MTPLALLGLAEEVLTRAGYRALDHAHEHGTTTGPSLSREYEDEFGVVSLAVFDTVAGLLDQWADAQAQLVQLISAHIRAEEAKAWDGYLVLLTPEIASKIQVSALSGVRYDTSRVRKLVASGADLSDTADVLRVLSPLLPLDLGDAGLRVASLDALPAILADRGIAQPLTREVIEAFEEQRPMIEAIADSLSAE